MTTAQLGQIKLGQAKLGNSTEEEASGECTWTYDVTAGATYSPDAAYTYAPTTGATYDPCAND